MLMPMRVLICLALAAASLAGAPPKKSRSVPAHRPGDFDYYLLALSWSPAYCQSSRSNEAQCQPGRNYSFVLHGLWPQFNKGDWPEFCTRQPGLSDPAPMLDIMPSEKLVAHEWAKHGTCSGLDAKSYFALSRRLFNTIQTPPRFRNLDRYITLSPDEVKEAFVNSNPGLKPSSIVVGCSANFLSEVRICMDKQGNPIPCVGQRDCRAAKVRVPPVR